MDTLYDYSIGYYGPLDGESWSPEVIVIRAKDFHDAAYKAEIAVKNEGGEIKYISKMGVSKSQLRVVK